MTDEQKIAELRGQIKAFIEWQKAAIEEHNLMLSALEYVEEFMVHGTEMHKMVRDTIAKVNGSEGVGQSEQVSVDKQRLEALERLYLAVKKSEAIRDEPFPLLADDETQATWLLEWESRLHPADEETESALEAMEAVDNVDSRTDGIPLP